MTTTYNVLIIEDEPWAIENYERALAQVENDLNNVKFRTDAAKTCQEAYDKIQKAIQSAPYDFVFLDIRLPASSDGKVRSGEVLGMMIRKVMPNAKIIVITSYDDSYRLNTIMSSLQPDSFLVKSDMVFNDLVKTIEKVLDHKNFYSNRVLTLLKQQTSNKGVLDSIDILLLYEISNGAKMKELLELLPLSKSGIEKRRSLIKEKFGDKGMSDRDMILAAKERGVV